MAHELPEFTDDLAHCDPCGWADAGTEYVPAIVGIAALDRVVNPFGGGWPVFAFLKRTCLRCGFQWAEAPLPPLEPRGPQCDVRSMAGAQCVLEADHFDPIRSHHKFGLLRRQQR